MGPRLCSRGDVGHIARGILYIAASMGPRLCSRGDRYNLVYPLPPGSFNGAAAL